MQLKVYRFHPGMMEPRYDTFQLEVFPGMTVLAALFQVQERFDDSLAFRYSCRGAVCGTCAMLINKVPRLACRTQIHPPPCGPEAIPLSPYPALDVSTSWNKEEEILVEPLPHFPVLRDLIVDMDRFFNDYRRIEPILKPVETPPEREWLMNPALVKELERYTGCILCGACVGACPVNAKNPGYLGPAALAALYRFYLDPREGREAYRLDLANRPEGWWACEFHTNCRRVCPKNVPPDVAIGHARMELGKRGMKPRGAEGE